MKKIILASLFSLILIGCEASVVDSGDRESIQNLSFNNPNNLEVTVNQLQPFNPEADIYVEIASVTDITEFCTNFIAERSDGRYVWDVQEEYQSYFNELKEKGYSQGLEDFESIDCWSTNIATEFIEVDGLNAVVHNQYFGQEVGSLNLFAKQIMIIDDYDTVYSVRFVYEFGELGDYLEKVGELNNGLAYDYDWQTGDGNAWDESEAAWQEVFDYLQVGDAIVFSDIEVQEQLVKFANNEKIIDDVIASIKIER